MGAEQNRRHDDNDETTPRRDVLTESWAGVPDPADPVAVLGDHDREMVSRDLTDFAERLGLVAVGDGSEAAEPGARTRMPSGEGLLSADQLRLLYGASGGRLSLARTVVDVLRGTDLPQDLSLTSFADFIATRTPTPHLGLSECDLRVASMLAHLSGFTKQTALQAMASLPAAMTEGATRDGESVLMRLRMAGVVTRDGGSGERNRLRIPGLLAAKLRFDSAARSDHDEILGRLVPVLVDQLENSQSVDETLLADVMKLSRRFGLWSNLVKLQESFGLSMFLRVPRTACAVFAGLPGEGIEAEPELGFFSQMAESLVERLSDGIDRTSMREALAEVSRPGQMRKHFPGTASAKVGGRGGEDYFALLRRIVGLSSTGQHVEAASLGLDWSARSTGRRAHLVIRFLTAVSLFHSARPHRAMSILHEIESPVAEGHVDGDFLLPAVLAWSALVGVYSGDHETADEYLARLDDEEWFPVVLDELVHPALRIAAAKRALDRLDLGSARREFEALAAYPENRSLWVFLPVIGRMIAVLTAASESGLLFVNDDVEKHRNAMAMSATGSDLLRGSRSMVFIGLGQLRWAELEVEGMSPDSDERIVLSVRIELVADRNESAISLADTWFYHQSLTPVSRAELAAIKAAALLRVGRKAEAIVEFETAAGLCSWVGSLLPLALLPQQDRVELIDLSRHSSVWDEVLSTFAGTFRDREEFMDCLCAVGAVAVPHAQLPQLNRAEAQLLDYLARGMSIAQISRELHQVTGTVKNRLSALYRKFGVSSKEEVVRRGRSLGFILPG